MLIIEIGNDYIKIGEKTYQGNIYDNCSFTDFIECENLNFSGDETAFLLDNSEIFLKEAEYINYKKRLKIRKEFSGILPNGKFRFISEEIEKNRILIYAVPEKIIELCYNIEKLLNIQISTIDHLSRMLVNYVKEKEKNETLLLIDLKDMNTVFGVIKKGVLKLQTTIKNIGENEIAGSASRIIKYYSDKNQGEHVKKVYLLNQKNFQFELKKNLEEKMLLEVVEVEKNNLFEEYAPGNLDFTKACQQGKGGLFYRTGILVMTVIMLILTTPQILGYMNAVSENKELQGDFDAIDDIIWIMEDELSFRSKLENARTYEKIINFLPEDVFQISVISNEEGFLINGHFITDFAESDLLNICPDLLIVKDYQFGTFELTCGNGGV